ncbi:MAG: hypothetical protein DDT32_00793 [Syntrophomonadaceae bacterium]|nr:hypothetical protein [Bacillota bacterium]
MDLNPALKIAVDDLKKTDFSDIIFRSGADLSGQEIRVRYLNRSYSLRLPDIVWEGKVHLREKIIILHYLTRSKGTPLSGRVVDLREVPGGNFYYPIFSARVHQPFLKAFGTDSALISKTDIRGQVIVPVFPKVSIQFVLYPEDEELPSDCKVLFDANISDYLATEDIVVVCEDAVKFLKDQGCHSCG